MPAETVPAIVGAVSALVGVAVGGFVAAHNQKRERQQKRISEQLAEFYSPMLALRLLILTKSEIRLKLSEAGNAAWQELIAKAREEGVEGIRKTRNERFATFERIISDNNRQFEEELVPSYRKMVELFTAKIHYAEPSTIKHFPALLEFVEIWNRWLDESLPHEVVEKLDHCEKSLHPFYVDVEANFTRMQNLLKENRRWRWRKNTPPVKVLPSR